MSGLNRPRGPVKVRALESFCVSRLALFLQSFLAEHSEIKLFLETGFHGDIVEQVLAHKVDFGIVPKDPRRDELIFEPLIDESMVLVSSLGIAKLVQEEGWGSLAGVQIIGFGRRCIYQTDGDRLIADMGVPMGELVTEFPSTELIRYMVTCGSGIAYLPEVTVTRELDEGTIARLPMPQPMQLTHGLIRHRDHELNAPSHIFRSKLLHFFGRHYGE